VTFRLADSLPAEKLKQWASIENRTQVLRKIQEWLDAGQGVCWMRRPELAGIVATALRHFDGQRYALGSFVVMPNHVHAVVTPASEWTLEKILHSWKSFTAHRINEALQRTGPVWQDESFDHVVRDEHHLREIEDYIRQNPVKAELRDGEYYLGAEQAGRLSH
jgi:REP element-mobilizing transposase RayT